VLAPHAQVKASAQKVPSTTLVKAQTASSRTLPLVPNGPLARRLRSAKWLIAQKMAARPPQNAHLHKPALIKRDVSHHALLLLVLMEPKAAKNAQLVKRLFSQVVETL
jgi:hypothetical protein